jgi:hypothetical protein
MNCVRQRIYREDGLRHPAEEQLIRWIERALRKQERPKLGVLGVVTMITYSAVASVYIGITRPRKR